MFNFTLPVYRAVLYLKSGPCSSGSQVGWNCLWIIPQAHTTARRGFGSFSLSPFICCCFMFSFYEQGTGTSFGCVVIIFV